MVGASTSQRQYLRSGLYQDAYLGSLRGGPALAEDEYAYIIELGTGAGRLGFFILQALRRIRDHLGGKWPILGAKPEICYVMTDVAMVGRSSTWMPPPANQT
eukprot:scaffold1736_cov143-Pinguiococcus_pyrenoidosus.AAC.1